MGRYALFSTGFEYKFGFATQESDEITYFGGDLMTLQTGEYHITWDAEFDIDVCKDRVEEYEDMYTYTPFNPADYSGDLKGTEKVRADYRYKHHTYLLGILIWHQLTWCPDLSATFDG